MLELARVSFDVGDDEAHQNLAYALAERQQFEPAIQHLRTAIELNPVDSGTRYDLAGVLLQQQDFAEAMRSCQSESRRSYSARGSLTAARARA